MTGFSPTSSHPSGGTTYTPPTTHAVYVSTTSCANNADTPLTWTFNDGTALLDVTAPTLPTVITAGIYAVTARFSSAQGFAGKSINVGLELDRDGFDFGIGGAALLDTTDVGSALVPLSMTGYCPAGAVLFADCYQDSGGALNVSFRAHVQRIT